MKKLIKYISIFSLVFALICSSFICVPAHAASEIELKWKDSVDENGYPIQVLDMTEEELQMYEIAQLKKKTESNALQRTSGYTYKYELVETLFDSGTAATSYVLIGARENWTQRESIEYGKSVSFSLDTVYKTITGTASMSISISDTISFDNRYDSKLGLFARLQTKKYKVTVTDKYTGNVVSTYYETLMSTVSNSYRPIYDKGDSNQTIFFIYGNDENTYNAKIIKTGQTTPVTNLSQIVTATRDRFPN